jgi:hypothetical protein
LEAWAPQTARLPRAVMTGVRRRKQRPAARRPEAGAGEGVPGVLVLRWLVLGWQGLARQRRFDLGRERVERGGLEGPAREGPCEPGPRVVLGQQLQARRVLHQLLEKASRRLPHHSREREFLGDHEAVGAVCLHVADDAAPAAQQRAARVDPSWLVRQELEQLGSGIGHAGAPSRERFGARILRYGRGGRLQGAETGRTSCSLSSGS